MSSIQPQAILNFQTLANSINSGKAYHLFDPSGNYLISFFYHDSARRYRDQFCKDASVKYLTNYHEHHRA